MNSSQYTIVVMGVSGVGKTTVARGLSEALTAQYIEADDFHSIENVEAMRAGIPLTDEMRQPWLKAITAEIDVSHKARPRELVILACSALKRTYRDILRTSNSDVIFVHLIGARNLIGARLAKRERHFMAPTLLDSQLATLEPLGLDENFVEIEVSKPLSEVLTDINECLDLDLPIRSRSAP